MVKGYIEINFDIALAHFLSLINLGGFISD